VAKGKLLQLRVEDADWKRWKEAAEQRGMSLSALVRWAMDRGLREGCVGDPVERSAVVKPPAKMASVKRAPVKRTPVALKRCSVCERLISSGERCFKCAHKDSEEDSEGGPEENSDEDPEENSEEGPEDALDRGWP